ncbi:hypothetical protein [Salegentibacter sp. Hel_I_6]|uniref:hypothetical protein n=1 Tax=Salegentibacter sp. Hel_I_6 TaxID=1250278 RepID=UPI0012E07F0F|nr:hypothetical protein [Salegentibacter sp. Hel_I_6]
MMPDKKRIKKEKRVYNVDKYVCKYIRENIFKGFDKEKPMKIADKFGIHYHTVEKILGRPDGYHIPVYTLSTICFYKGMKLSQFFKEVERLYGRELDDSYKLK